MYGDLGDVSWGECPPGSLLPPLSSLTSQEESILLVLSQESFVWTLATGSPVTPWPRDSSTAEALLAHLYPLSSS